MQMYALSQTDDHWVTAVSGDVHGTLLFMSEDLARKWALSQLEGDFTVIPFVVMRGTLDNEEDE